MSENLISSLHIEKLGHEIQEIRERALNNILSKLNHGYQFDNDLARSRELLTKLFDWFLFEPCTKQEQVLQLIQRILQSECGRVLLNHIGAESIKNDFIQILRYIDTNYNSYIDDITNILDKRSVVVPPLETDIPLSYRSGQSSCRSVESTATPIEGYTQQESSRQPQSGVIYNGEINEDLPRFYIIEPLKWQILIESDRQVLQSVENNLTNPKIPSDLLKSTEFFNSVLIHDFPAEVFLQRPTIILAFNSLLSNCPSIRLTNSILNCLINLTKALKIRINHYNDPCMYNLKDDDLQLQSLRESNNLNDEMNNEIGEIEDYNLLKQQQITFPHYCSLFIKNICKYLLKYTDNETIKSPKKANQEGTSLSLILLDELINLLSLTLNKNIWNEQLHHKVLKELTEIFLAFGDILEYYRIEAVSEDKNLINRAIQLTLIQNSIKLLKELVPKQLSISILPKIFKNSLTNLLIDVILSRLYPETFNLILEYVESFSHGLESDSILKYRETNRVCKSMSAAVDFFKKYPKLNAIDGVILAEKSLPCLDYHQDINFVKCFMELATNKLLLCQYDDDLYEKYEHVTLKLLSNNSMKIKKEMYKLCHEKIIATVGPKLQFNEIGANQIVFLLKSSILTEIACFGLTSEDEEIKNYSENIIIHLIKCKILVSDGVWSRILLIFKQSLAILLCYVDKNSTLGRTLIDLIDPDNIENLSIDKIDIVRFNVILLFIKDLRIREEGFSRLCWLLTLQENSKDYLPRLNNIYNTLPNICQIQKIIDLNKNRNIQHFYQPSSLQQVLDLLKSEHAEPVIRRSALTQLSVMMEDPLLHRIFIDENGVNLLIDIMRNSLIEKKFTDYPDSIIPIISILKNLCLFQPFIRNELYLNLDLYYYILRGLFLFCNEERLKYDGCCLLFLLIYHNFIRGNPSQGDLAIPELVQKKLQIPFLCQTYWKINENSNNLIDLLLNDKWCLSSLQIQWNLDNYGLNELLTWEIIDNNNKNNEIIEHLKLNNYDLFKLKGSSLDYCIEKNLIEIQNSTTHDTVINCIHNLIMYLNLYNISNNDRKSIDLIRHEWETSFMRFLKILPSSDIDVKLLINIIKMLKFLAPIYKSTEKSYWMLEFLKNPSNHLLDVINLATSIPEDTKILGQHLLSLITICSLQEQQFFYYYPIIIKEFELKSTKSWLNIIELIVDNLKLNNTEYFYNLSYLDALLSCLVHLTATLGWWKLLKSNQDRILSQLITYLCEMIMVFYCGKGLIATVSMMGSSIIRHIIMILNHLLSEMNYSKIKQWENYFLNINNNLIKSFILLTTNRDVILRAASLQLFAGLTQSPQLSIEIVHELNKDNQNIWQISLDILLDHNEASIVRENCALLLTNLISHTNQNGQDLKLISGLIPKLYKKEENDIESLFKILEDRDFYKTTILIFTALYTNRLIETENKLVTKNQTDRLSFNSNDILTFITTPSFIKSLLEFIINLHKISNEYLSRKLQDYGLIKLIFRCLCDAVVEINDTRKLSVYCEILEMNTIICYLLKQITHKNSTCLGTILYTRDCLNVLLRLLNRNIYYTNLPPLLYLRNRLWAEIFQLLSTLMTYENYNCEKTEQLTYESLTIIIETINETGKEAFLTTLCESIQLSQFNDLQNATLIFLISFLNIRAIKKIPKIQQLFDNTEMRLVGNCEDSQQEIKQNTDTYKLNLLHKTLFNKQIDQSTNRMNKISDNSMCGEQICKILLKLYNLVDVKTPKENLRKKSLIIGSITCLLSVSEQAKIYAYNDGFLNRILQQIREIYIKLSLESVDNLKRLVDKKRLSPLLQELNEFIGLLMNFMVDDERIKNQLVDYDLADIVHKLWIWFLVQKDDFINVLKMLCNFTTNCNQACLSLTLTNQSAGSGPRKTPSNISLLHTIINLVDKEMEQISKTHKLEVLNLCFSILINCCTVNECRLIYTKSNLLNGVTRLHPAITRKQKPWETVELYWLDFLQNFTLYAEGQNCVARIVDVFDILILLTNSTKTLNRLTSLLVLRNIAFCHSNRTRLLTSDDFLKLLQTKLDIGNQQEQMVVVLILWTLVANNQRAKIIFKSAQIDLKLQKLIQHYEIVDNTALTNFLLSDFDKHDENETIIETGEEAFLKTLWAMQLS